MARPLFPRYALSSYFWRKSLAGGKIGRSLTSSSEQELVSFSRRFEAKIGGSSKWRKDYFATLREWIVGETNHESVTDRLVTLACEGGSPSAPHQTLALSQLSGALGLHVASLALEKRAWKQIVKNVSHRHPDDVLRWLQVTIYQGLLPEAIQAADKLRKALTREEMGRYSYSDVFNYISVWSGEDSASFPLPHDSVTADWNRELNSRRVTIYGPGLVADGTPDVPEDELVIRIAGPGSYEWTNPSDHAQGRTDIVYVIPETLQNIGNNDEERKQLFLRHRYICVKRGNAPYLPNSRRVETGSRLFLRGHPNVVPLICLDVLRVQGARVHVIGSDFFANSVAYREDSKRTVAPGPAENSAGSPGAQFDRSTLLASHNAFQNRALVKNLVNAGRVEGDATFRSVVDLSEEQYASRLDEIYGKSRT